MLLVLGLHSCGPLGNMQKVESNIPCIGAIGKYRSKLFTKDFQKMGEPSLEQPIAVSLQSVAFTPALWSRYNKHEEKQGNKPKTAYGDSTEVQARFFTAQISDAMGLTAQLNSSTNQIVQDYLKEDKDLVLLTGISFVTDEETKHIIHASEHYYLREVNGALTLELHSGLIKSQIKMSSLQIFDFEVSGLCWKLDQSGNPEIAAILLDGNSCPGQTESDPNKLNRTKTYLKL